MEPTKKTKKILVKRVKPPVNRSFLNDSQNASEGSQLSPSVSKESPEDPTFTMNFGLHEGENVENVMDLLGKFPEKFSKAAENVMKNISEDDLEKMCTEDIANMVVKNMDIPKTEGLDLGSVMKELMKGAEKLMQTQQEEDNNAPPPVPPTERSGKYPGEAQFKQKQTYEKFNSKLLETFNMLSKVLPHKAKLYVALQKTVHAFAESDASKPWKIWTDSVKGNEERVRTYSAENIKYICENINKFDLLKMLELEGEWKNFSSSDLNDFWYKLNELQMFVDNPNVSNDEEEKRKHLIYKGFNVCFLGVVDFLKASFPEREEFYVELSKNFIQLTQNDANRLMIWWTQSTKGYQNKLITYSVENVREIYKNIDKIGILQTLELKKVASPEMESFNKQLWSRLSKIENISEMIESIPSEMMTAIQNMTLRIGGQNMISPDGKLKNPTEMMKVLAKSVFDDTNIVKGMSKMSQQLLSAMADSELPIPPGYSRILEKMEK